MPSDLPPPRATSLAKPTTPRLPQRQVLADDVYEAVKALVMDHVIAPGARVSIDGLARQLGVSQTPIREALARLESDGLVVKEPLRGYSATPLLTRSEVDDLFQFRLLVEPWAASRAAELATRDDHARIATEIASCPDAPPGDEYEAYKALAAHDSRFHNLLASLAGNQQLRLALERTHCHLHIFRLYSAGGGGTQTLAEHQRIAAALTRGSASAAARAMCGHLESARDRLRASFE
ncbi:MAG TPA: GntR family transcriptional regulator [Planosporangium sp.]|jgi:DNA-binding GntR family transcriptional regulator|nr:GntR family transcriptional regulator [Planosporangium sp.]